LANSRDARSKPKRRRGGGCVRKHDTVVAALDDAARWQLRRLYIDTKQTDWPRVLRPTPWPRGTYCDS